MWTRLTAVLIVVVAARVALGDENATGQVKVAAVQMLGYDKTDLPREGYNPAGDVVRYIERAAADGAELVVFPEYLLGHISIPGPQTNQISQAAAAGKIYVIVGCWETYPDSTYANTALLFDRSGKIAGKYHKVHAAVDQWEGEPPWSQPPAGKDRQWFLTNDPEWKMQPGNAFPVFELDFGKIGILTCYDGWFPESFRALSLNGAEMLVWINGRRGSVEDFLVRAAAFRNEVAVVATNQAYGAGTMIAQWPSQILAQADKTQEDYLIATIDFKKIRHVRHFSRNAAQRRPDTYQVITQPLEAAQ